MQIKWRDLHLDYVRPICVCSTVTRSVECIADTRHEILVRPIGGAIYLGNIVELS